jgi:hypothetical protein
MDNFKDIIIWRPVTAITGSAYLTSAVFDPSLCQIISLQQGKKFKCYVNGTGKYDGEHYCIIDKIVYENDRTVYVATFPIAWAGSPETHGFIKFL